MDASELIAAGNLDSALKQLKESLRNAPADPALRSLLFQLYCLVGNWSGALNQLEVLSELGPEHEMFAQVYKRVLKCEESRRRVASGAGQPVIFGEPEEWVGCLVQAVQILAGGNIDAAVALQQRAFEMAPASAGTLDEERFEWIADADSFLGPIVEVYVEGNFWWVPFSRIQSIKSEGPKFILDAIWLPVEFCWTNGGTAAGFIPVRYVGSEDSKDAACQLGRRTEWKAVSPDVYRGLGQRMFTTDIGDRPLLEFRKLELNPTSA